MKKSILMIVNSLALVLFSCNQPTDKMSEPIENPQDYLFVNCSVRYTDVTHELRVLTKFATVDSAGNRQSYRPVSAVRFYDHDLAYSTKLDAYTWSGVTSFEPPFALSFHDKNNKLTEYEIGFQPIKSFKIKEGIISKTSGFTLLWEGAAVEEKEILLISIASKQGGQPTLMKRVGGTQTNELGIFAGQLSKTTTGKSEMFLMKSKSEVIKTKNNIAGGILIEHYTKPIEVLVKN